MFNDLRRFIIGFDFSAGANFKRSSSVLFLLEEHESPAKAAQESFHLWRFRDPRVGESVMFHLSKDSQSRTIIVVLSLSGHAEQPSMEVPDDADLLAHTHKTLGSTYGPWEDRVYVMNAR